MTLLVFLYVIFSRIDKSSPKGILRGLVDGIQSQLPENILPMRIDSMETGEAFLGNLPGSHAQGDVLPFLAEGIDLKNTFPAFDVIAQRPELHQVIKLRDKALYRRIFGVIRGDPQRKVLLDLVFAVSCVLDDLLGHHIAGQS